MESEYRGSRSLCTAGPGRKEARVATVLGNGKAGDTRRFYAATQVVRLRQFFSIINGTQQDCCPIVSPLKPDKLH